MAAETPRALVSPAVTWTGVSRPPVAENTEPSTAMPRHGAELTQRVGSAGGDALELPGSVPEGELGDRREEEAQAGARDDERRDEVGVGDVGVISVASQPIPIACKRDADGDDPRPPRRSASSPATGAVTAGAAVQGRPWTPAASGV